MMHRDRRLAQGGLSLAISSRGIIPRSLLAGALAFAFDGVCAATWTVHGRVTAVADGDSITVVDDAKKQHKVRLAGVDAPDGRQAYADQSKEQLTKLVHGKRVRAVCYKRDRRGQEYCNVFVDSRNVGLEQVRTGMAWWFRQMAKEQSAADHGAYEGAQTAARVTRRGLWQGANAVVPSEAPKRARLSE